MQYSLYYIYFLLYKRFLNLFSDNILHPTGSKVNTKYKKPSIFHIIGTNPAFSRLTFILEPRFRFAAFAQEHF